MGAFEVAGVFYPLTPPSLSPRPSTEPDFRERYPHSQRGACYWKRYEAPANLAEWGSARKQ